MSLAAIDDIDDAFEATRAFLLPLDAGRWLRLAVIAFFVGGAGSAGGSLGGSSGSGGPSVDPETGTLPVDLVPDLTLTDPAFAAIVAIGFLALVVGLVVAVLGAIMEFVLVESLRREAVELRTFGRRYWRGGIRLFAFRLGVGLLGLAAVVGLIGAALVAAGVPGGDINPLGLLAALGVVLPVVGLLAVGTLLMLGLTRDFVVPVMLLEGTTVLGAWRRFWPTLRRDWREYAVYVVVSFVLRLVAGMVVGALAGLAAVVVIVPLGLVALAVIVAGGGQLGVASLVGLGILALVAVLALLAIAAVVQVPVVTYFRYYSLLVLGDTEPTFDVIADQRAAIRTGEGT